MEHTFDLFSLTQSWRLSTYKYKTDLSFYADFINWVSLVPIKSNQTYYGVKCDTAFATVLNGKLTIGYNVDWFAKLDDAQKSYVLIHEINHLLSSHSLRGHNLNRDKTNIAQDVIINTIIDNFDCSDFQSKKPLVKSPTYKTVYDDDTLELLNVSGDTRIGIFFENTKFTEEIKRNDIPKMTFEELYMFIPEKEKNGSCDGEGSCDGDGNWDLHIESSNETKEMMSNLVGNIIDSMKARGLNTGSYETIINVFGKPKKDYIKFLKSKIESNLVKINKNKTWKKSHRLDLPLKGSLKNKGNQINVILDTSGSMTGNYNSVLKYLNSKFLDSMCVMVDTEVKKVTRFTKETLSKPVAIKGGGGTILQPAVNFLVENNRTKAPTLVLTDGYTDTLDFSCFNNEVLIITSDVIPEFLGQSVKAIKAE